MTTPSSGLPPANWYPDPQTPGQLRYWDGTKWTQHVHQVEQQPAQAASGFASPGPQTAANPLAQAVQESDANPYTPVVQPSPLANAQPQTGPIAAGPATGGTFVPTGQAATGPATGQAAAGPATGQAAAGPATGGTFMPTGQQGAAGGFPATGATPTVQPGAIQPGASAAGSGILQAPKPRDLDADDLETPSSTAPQAALAAILGVVAFALDFLGIYEHLGDYGEYWAYAGAGLGFVAVFLGFLGRRKAAGGFIGGSAFAWGGIFAGFLSMMLAAYEILFPGELLNIFSDYLPF